MTHVYDGKRSSRINGITYRWNADRKQIEFLPPDSEAVSLRAPSLWKIERSSTNSVTHADGKVAKARTVVTPRSPGGYR